MSPSKCIFSPFLPVLMENLQRLYLQPKFFRMWFSPEEDLLWEHGNFPSECWLEATGSSSVLWKILELTLKCFNWKALVSIWRRGERRTSDHGNRKVTIRRKRSCMKELGRNESQGGSCRLEWEESQPRPETRQELLLPLWVSEYLE